MGNNLRRRLEEAFRERIRAHGIVDTADLARAALDVIREPTEAQTAAAVDIAHWHAPHEVCFLGDAQAAETWRAMVDAERRR